MIVREPNIFVYYNLSSLVTSESEMPLTLSLSHPPLWRIDLPAVEKIFNIDFLYNSERTHMIALVSCQASISSQQARNGDEVCCQ